MAGDIPILTLLVVLPALGAAIVALLPKQMEQPIRYVALGFAAAVAVLSFVLLAGFDGDNGGFQFISEHSWISSLGISWKLGVDGISLFLVVMTGVLFPLAMAGPRSTTTPRATWRGCSCSRRAASACSCPSTSSCSSCSGRSCWCRCTS